MSVFLAFFVPASDVDASRLFCIITCIRYIVLLPFSAARNTLAFSHARSPCGFSVFVFLFHKNSSYFVAWLDFRGVVRTRNADT